MPDIPDEVRQALERAGYTPKGEPFEGEHGMMSVYHRPTDTPDTTDEVYIEHQLQTYHIVLAGPISALPRLLDGYSEDELKRAARKWYVPGMYYDPLSLIDTLLDAVREERAEGERDRDAR